MKITKRQLSELITEVLKSVKYASKADDGYEFTSTAPENAEELYGKDITDVVSNVENIDNFFKESIIDVNMIIIPDRAFKGMIIGIANYFNYDLTDIFTAAIDNSILSKMLYGISAKVRGLGNELSQVRTQLDQEAYNIIVQRKDKTEADAFMFDLSWLTHDLFGHALNFQGSSPLLNIADGLVSAITLGKVGLDNFAIGGEFEKQARVTDRRMIGKSMTDKNIVKSFQKEFNDEGFTPDVGHFDLGASIIGYYVIKGRFPQTMYDGIASGEIDQSAINKLEKELVNRINSLKGKAGFVNFGDLK
jgi:hypothetical protein